jgi:hypothetical protein
MPRAKKTKGQVAEGTEGHGITDQTGEETKRQGLRRIKKQCQEELVTRFLSKDANEGSSVPGDQDQIEPVDSPENDQEIEDTQDLNEQDVGPFYSLVLPFPKKYHKLAEVLALIHHYQSRYEMTMPDFGEDIPIHESVMGIRMALDHNHECSNDLLISNFIDWLGTGDHESVFLAAQAFKAYELSLPGLDGERNRGKFCAMVACNDLQRAGLSRAQISKAKVREIADQLRAILELKRQRSAYTAGRKITRRGFKWSEEKIQKQIKQSELAKSDWTCIWNDLGLRDIKGNPGNQKTNPTEL